MVSPLARLGITPNMLTLVGLVLNAGVGVLLGVGIGNTFVIVADCVQDADFVKIANKVFPPVAGTDYGNGFFHGVIMIPSFALITLNDD